MCGPSSVATSRALYKHLLRQTRRLPAPVQPHYRHMVRQGFVQHGDETQPDRVRQIIERAVQDAAWVVDKYSKKPVT